MTDAAIMQPSQVCTTLMFRDAYIHAPKGRLNEKRRSRKKPDTVGASIMGRISMLSTTDFTFRGSFMTCLATSIPRKKHMTVATIPVFREIQNGLQSNFEIMLIISSMFLIWSDCARRHPAAGAAFFQ